MKYARKKRTGKKSVSKQARAIVKASKSLMLKQVETKYISYDGSTELNNEDIYSYSPTQQVGVGNTAITRIGDSILLQSLTLSGQWICATDILNVKYRIIVGWTRNQTANTSMSNSVMGSTDLFYSISGGLWANRIVNPAIFTVLYDEVVDINSNTATGTDGKSFYTIIGLGLKKFDYATYGGSLGKNRNLMVCVIPSLTAGQTPPTSTGSIQLHSVLKFKDP